MAEALRAALRLLPVVKSSPSPITFGACSRASAVRRSNTRASENQQPVLLSLPLPNQQQQQALPSEKNLQSVTGLARFARAVLALVGVGVSAVAANQLAGPSIVHGRELPSSGVDKHAMAAAEARAVWQRTAANKIIQEDKIRAPKLAHCPTQKSQDCHSFYSSSTWGSLDTKVDFPRQLSPSGQRDYRSEYLGLDEILGSRFKPGLQALAAERSNMKSGSAGYMGVTSEYESGNELDLGWQFVVDPKPKAGLSVPTEATEVKTETEEEEAVGVNDEEGETAVLVGNITGKTSITTKTIMMKNLEISDDHVPDVARTERNDHQVGHDSTKSNQHREGTSWVTGRCTESPPAFLNRSTTSSPVRGGNSWRTANKEALAALVAQKTSEKLENCDLPTPKSKVAYKTPLESWDVMVETPLQISKSLDRDLMACIFQGGEPTRLESMGLPFSPLIYGSSDLNLTPSIPAKVSQPLNIPTVSATCATHRGSHSYSSRDNRISSWSGGEGATGSSLGKGSGPLGEALCHSQTRAREAEHQAEQTYQDYKKVSRLFFREASLSLTYRQWVSSLQAENARLKTFIRNHHGAIWLQQNFLSPFTALDRLSSNRWKVFGKELARRQMWEHFAAVRPKFDPAVGVEGSSGHHGASLTLGCTIGFAFALGLSLAGAGLMLGWSMGWILLAY